MPKKILVDYTSAYQKLLIGFSILSLVVAMVLFIPAVLQQVVWIVLGLLTIVGIVAVYSGWRHKAVRIIGRVLILLMLAVTLVSSGMLLAESLQTGSGWLIAIANFLILLQPLLLFFLPFLALAGSYARKFDLVVLRVAGVLTLVLAMLTCVEQYYGEGLIFMWDNLFVSLFYTLCVAVTVVTAFLIYPMQFPRLRKWVTARFPKIGRRAAVAEDTDE